MDSLQSDWRRCYKVIAYSDFVAMGVYMFLSLLFLANGATPLFHKFGIGIGSCFGHKHDALIIISVAFCLATFVVVMICAQLFAILKLHSAAEERTDQIVAVGNVLFWKNISFVFIFFAVMGCFIMPLRLGLFMIVWRLGALFVVNNFKQQLEGNNNSANSTNSENVNETRF